MKIVRLFFDVTVESLFPKRISRTYTKVKGKKAKHLQRYENMIRVGNIEFRDEDILNNVSALNQKRLNECGPGTAIHLFDYQDTCIKPFLWLIKYYCQPDFIKLAADIWSDELIATHCEHICMLSSLLVHPPSSGFHQGKKEFDQIEVLINEMINRTSLGNFYDYFRGAFEYSNATELITSQHTGTRKERFNWTQDKFKLSNDFKEKLSMPKKQFQNIHIMCIDDVTTTGATFNAIKALIIGEKCTTRRFDTSEQNTQLKTDRDWIKIEFSAFAH